MASALVVDAMALGAIATRISGLGVTPNRTAALAENLILLVNLAWTAWLYAQFLRGARSFSALERWQMEYLPVYSVWAADHRRGVPAPLRLRLSAHSYWRLHHY